MSKEVEGQRVPISFTDGRRTPVKFIKDGEIPPEKREYLILYYSEIEDEEVKSFEIITGRKKAYEFVRSIIEYIDIHESKVLVSGATLENCKTVYEYMKLMEVYFEDSFDIEDYNMGDIVD